MVWESPKQYLSKGTFKYYLGDKKYTLGTNADALIPKVQIIRYKHKPDEMVSHPALVP